MESNGELTEMQLSTLAPVMLPAQTARELETSEVLLKIGRQATPEDRMTATGELGLAKRSRKLRRKLRAAKERCVAEAQQLRDLAKSLRELAAAAGPKVSSEQILVLQRRRISTRS